MSKEITISEIAKECGVSKATISRVLNNSENVKYETKQKVLKVINKRQYSPSAQARNLSKKKSTTIGVVVPEVNNTFFGEMLRGITELADESNYTIICCNTDDKYENDVKALQMLREQRVLGLLYTPAKNYIDEQEINDINNLLKSLHAPIVIMDREMDSLQYDAVYFDDKISTYNATKKFIEAGHTKIGIINADLEKVLAKVRFEGFKQALDEHGLKVYEQFVLNGNYKASKTYELVKTMLIGDDLPTAVLTCNNRTSIGFFKAIYESNNPNARKISHIGLDEIEALDILRSDFNFIKRDSKDMGKKSMILLKERIAKPKKERETIRISSKMNIKNIEKLIYN